MEGTPDNGSGGGGFTSDGEIPPLPIVLYNADTNNWECVSCVTTFQTEGQLDAHLQLHNELGRSIITTTPTTPEKFSFDNPNDFLQSSSFDAPDFDDFITEFEKITGGSGQDGISSEQSCPLIAEDRFISGSASGTTIPTTTTTFSSTVINVPSVINPLLHLQSPPLPPPPPVFQRVTPPQPPPPISQHVPPPQPPPPPVSQRVPPPQPPPPPVFQRVPPQQQTPPISQPPPPPVVQIGAGPSKVLGVGPIPQPLSPKPASRPRKRYPCSQCSKDFSRPSYLRKHQETNHNQLTTTAPSLTDVSKICPICSIAFSTQWHLTQHMKTHTSEMSYCCAHCGKEFADRENMQKHMEVHKPEVTNPPLAPSKIMDQSFTKLDGSNKDHCAIDIGVGNPNASTKFKSENYKIPLPSPSPPVVDLEEETDVIMETDLEPELDDDEDNDGFECRLCDKIFNTIKQLRIHERMMHEDKLMEVDKHHDIPSPQIKFNSIANTLLKNESLLRSMSMSRRNKRKRWSLSTMEKYEYCASLICDIKKKLSKALKILEPGSFDRRLRRKIRKRRRDSDNEWSCKVTSSGIKIYNQKKFQPVSITAQICTTNIYACIVCGLKVNSVTILKRHVLAEHANIIGGPPPSEVRVRPSTPPASQKQVKPTFTGPLSKSPQKLMGSSPMAMGHEPLSKTAGPSLKTSGPLSKTTGPTSKTFGPLSKTSGPLSKTSGPLSKTSGPLSKTSGPLSKTSGPLSKTSGPLSKTSGPLSKTTGPTSKTFGPLSKTSGPLSKIADPSSETFGPHSKTAGSSSKSIFPLSKIAGPSSKTMDPLSKTAGPSSKTMGPDPSSNSAYTSLKTTAPLSKTIGPLIRPIVPPTKSIGPLIKPIVPPTKSIGPVFKQMGLPSKQTGLPPKPMGPALTQMDQLPRVMGPPKPNGTAISPYPKKIGLSPSTSLGPPPSRIVPPQNFKASDDDLIVIYETVNLNKSPTKSPLKPGTGKRTTNFAANQAKKKAERIVNQASLEKAQIAEMESRGEKSVINVNPIFKNYEGKRIFGRVNVRDFQEIRSILGSSRAIVKLTTSMKSRPELPTPSQRKSEQSLLNDKITIASASEQARKDRRKSLLLNQPPPVKSSITTRSKSLMKMEKELRVVLTRIDDDSFDFTELLFLNKMC